MDGGFTLLAFGLCAAITEIHGTPVVELGGTIASKCETSVYVGDSHGEVANILGHDISVEILDDIAVVTVDGKKTVIQRTEGA